MFRRVGGLPLITPSLKTKDLFDFPATVCLFPMGVLII